MIVAKDTEAALLKSDVGARKKLTKHSRGLGGNSYEVSNKTLWEKQHDPS